MIVRVILPARDIPDGARVRKVGEPQEFTLGSVLAGWDYPSQKREPVKAPRGYRFLIENVDLGIGVGIPDNLDLIWFREENIEQDLKLYVYDRGVAGISVVVESNSLDAALRLRSFGVHHAELITQSSVDGYDIVRGLVIDNS